jgi:amino acid adenylation domain-containing protein
MSVERVLAQLLDCGAQIAREGENLSLRAPTGAVPSELRQAVRDHKGEILALLEPGQRLAPISSQEQRLWYIHTHEGGGNAYNMNLAWTVRGPLHIEALDAALRTVAARHETLRTRYVALDGKPYRLVAPKTNFQLRYEDCSRLDECEAREKARALSEAFSRRAFDLESGDLIRAAVYCVCQRRHEMRIILHHIAADGWSMGVLMDELFACYEAQIEGSRTQLPELRQTFSDCVGHQHLEWRAARDEKLAFWKEELSGPLPPAQLPMDRQTPPPEAHESSKVSAWLSEDLAERLQGWAREHDATVFGVLLGAFAALLYRYGNQQSAILGITSALREQEGSENLIGFLANTLPLKIDVDNTVSFSGLVRQVRETLLRVREHSDTPFEEIVGEVRPPRQPGFEPLIHALFTMSRVPSPVRETTDGVIFERKPMAGGAARAPLAAVFENAGKRVRFTLDYDCAFFDDATAARMHDHYLRLLEEGLRDSEAPLSRLPLVGEDEERLLRQWNATEREYPARPLVHERIAEIAAEYPERLALADDAREFTYGEMEASAASLARALRERGAAPEQFVALCLPRSPEMVLGQLATVKAGAAYVALDPDQPDARLKFMIETSAPCAILCCEKEEDRFRAFGFPVLTASFEEQHPGNGHDADVDAKPEQAVYVIFTSGSTGAPKGVVVEHRNLLNLCCWHQEHFGHGTESRVSAVMNPAFDAAASESWPALYAGGSVHFPIDETRLNPPALRDWIVSRQLTLATMPTVLGAELIALPWPQRSALQHMICGGERLRRSPHEGIWFQFYNCYGPTENTVGSTLHPVQPHDGDAPPIGQPVPNTQVWVLDEHGRHTPIGVPGEMHLGGEQVARGYVNRPELTEERFVSSPFGRLYRTGDFARWRSDGVLEFIGRHDDQLQLRGHRIEPAEIERVICAQDWVEQAAVVLDERSEPRLAAYLVASGALDAPQLHARLQEELPKYMMPARFVLLDRMPVTQNDKIDRKLLATAPPQGEEILGERASRTAPRTPEEAAVAGIWQEVLDIPEVGVYDDFFSLGGHSLLATQALSRMQEDLGVDIGLKEFLAAPTVAALAQKTLAKAGGEASAANQSRSADRKPPLSVRSLEQLEALSEEQLERALKELE